MSVILCPGTLYFTMTMCDRRVILSHCRRIIASALLCLHCCTRISSVPLSQEQMMRPKERCAGAILHSTPLEPFSVPLTLDEVATFANRAKGCTMAHNGQMRSNRSRMEVNVQIKRVLIDGRPFPPTIPLYLSTNLRRISLLFSLSVGFERVFPYSLAGDIVKCPRKHLQIH